jgi:hypothetical protein
MKTTGVHQVAGFMDSFQIQQPDWWQPGATALWLVDLQEGS